MHQCHDHLYAIYLESKVFTLLDAKFKLLKFNLSFGLTDEERFSSFAGQINGILNSRGPPLQLCLWRILRPRSL